MPRGRKSNTGTREAESFPSSPLLSPGLTRTTINNGNTPGKVSGYSDFGGTSSMAQKMDVLADKTIAGLLGDDGLVKNRQKNRWTSAATVKLQTIQDDLELRCSDGVVWADQAIASAASSFLKRLCNEQSMLLSSGGSFPDGAGGPARMGMVQDRRKQNVVFISLPDVDCKTLATVFGLFYNGSMNIETTPEDKQGVETIKKVKACWKLLDIDITTLKSLELTSASPVDPKPGESRVVVRTYKEQVTGQQMPGVKREPGIFRSPVVGGRPTRAASNNISYTEEDPDLDPDDPAALPDINRPNGATIKRKIEPAIEIKKVARIESGRQVYSAQAIHRCVICKGKHPDGKIDKDASNLSFNQLRRLKEHYAKCLYGQGKVSKFVNPEEFNLDKETGKVIDEFGRQYKYQCSVAGCWKQKKNCGYKELAMHNTVEHGVIESVLELETDPELLEVLAAIRKFEQMQREIDKPLNCKVTGCNEKDVPFIIKNNYKELKGHYAMEHYRAWFVSRDDGGNPRTQKVTEPGKGTICGVCGDRVYGNEDKMMEHYASKHERLADAVIDGCSGVNVEDARKILVDLFPDRLADYDYQYQK